MTDPTRGVTSAQGQAELPSPLDEPQEFSDASSYQVRDELAGLIERDLLGPWDGELEVFPPRSAGPCERYLVGRLGPRHDPRSSQQSVGDAVDTEISAGGDAADGELPDLLTMQNAGRMWASSMGLSFVVAPGADELSVSALWGRYGKSEVLDEAGNPRRIWSREPVALTRLVRLDGAASQRIPLTGTNPRLPGVYLAVEVRPRPDGPDSGARVVELVLVNAQEEPAANKDTAWLFQPRLTVSAARPDTTEAPQPGGDVSAEPLAPAVFGPIDDPVEDLAALDAGTEERHLRLLYRNHLRHAVGRNVAVHADLREGERRAHRLATTWLPAYDVPITIAPPAGPGSHLAGVQLSMDELAIAEPGQLAYGLGPLAAGYEAWLDEQEAAVPELPEALRETAATAVFTARQCAARIRAGIDLLTSPAVAGHETALEAFRFASKAMALQRRHTALAALRESGGLSYAEAMAEVEGQGADAASWFPFQLAFILLNLPALTDPAHPDRAQPSQPVGGTGHNGLVDLLFFPTGGGKTEAYLGLAAYTFAIRRRQGILTTPDGPLDGGRGVAVLMRYTLRLLTAQQFQRATALVCAAERVRLRDEATWGTEPLRIGLWVGTDVSPKRYDEAELQLNRANRSGGGYRLTVLQIQRCPWCGGRISARNVRTDGGIRRVFVYCGDDLAACPFAEGGEVKDGLPVLTVDEEIYRLAPTSLIATVDKFARLAREGEAASLFGYVSRYCERHGFVHPDYRHCDIKDGSKHPASKHGFPAAAVRPTGRLRPPDLIIQDELHLITGALGTTVGLFEVAIDVMTAWRTAAGDRVRPLLVASTATARNAPDQVRALYGRDVTIFPPQVLDAGRTFFSKEVPLDDENPGRRYVGISTTGVRLTTAEIRI